jgi:hypothetical protein
MTQNDLPIQHLSCSAFLRNFVRHVFVGMIITEAISVKLPVIILVMFVSLQSIHSILCRAWLAVVTSSQPHPHPHHEPKGV